jgi:hypothetical protein
LPVLAEQGHGEETSGILICHVPLAWSRRANLDCTLGSWRDGPLRGLGHYRDVVVERWQEIDWSAIPGPPEYRPDTVATAFRALLAPHPDDRADPATMMRFAVGNDHGGTIYPAAVAATAAMLDIIEVHPGQPRRAALGILLDWWASFDPEPDYEEYLDAAGERVDVVAAIRRAVLGATHVLEHTQEDQRDAVAGRLAAELLACARSGWGVWIEQDGSICHRTG